MVITEYGTANTAGNPDQALAWSVRQAYRSYVAFHSDYEEAESGTLMLWTFHTWVFDVADCTPYILVTAPTSEAGKSRIFDVARCLVRRPHVAVDPTPASLFRAIDLMQPTLLLDEADMLRENKQLKVVLNSGFQPGTPVIRASGAFEVFCPKAFSGIAGERPPLTDATLSRCIQIPMRRKGPGEKIAKFKLSRVMAELAGAKYALEDWALRSRDLLRDAEPAAIPSELTDRQADAWEPLFAIADLLGASWGAAARTWAVTLSRAIPKPPDAGVQLLRDCKRVLDGWAGNRIPTRTLARLRNDLDEREFDEAVSPNQLSRRLNGFGIHPAPSPWHEAGHGSPTVRGYVFRRGGEYTQAWADVFARYLS